MTLSLQSEQQGALFDRWADVYDSALNPLLMLEEQTLPPLLPSITGQHVLDVGCGTGRWLSRLAALQPGSLIGVDGSAEMLRRAREKLDPTAHLLQSDAHALPVPDASQDFILSSFVVSYLKDLAAFAFECERALKPGGHLLLSDMHPKTARQRGWTRSFTAEGETFRITVWPQQLTQIVKAFSRAGFKIIALREASFSSAQRPVFEETGRLHDFLALAGVPAIYLLKLRKPLHAQRQTAAGSSNGLQIANAPRSTSQSTWTDAFLSIEKGSIVPGGSLCHSADEAIDLSGYVLLTGLIDSAHDLDRRIAPPLPVRFRSAEHIRPWQPPPRRKAGVSSPL
jgi:ubiquinone/menaquinone biosynthesis C-methylase UbiE